MEIDVVKSNCTPLCFTSSKKLIAYRLGEILIINDDKIERRYTVFKETKETVIGRFNYLYRLLRLGIRASIALDDNVILISKGNRIYEFNICNGEISNGYQCGAGIRPLIFSDIKNIKYIKDGIYFGGYLGNKEKNPVSIYRRIGIDHWEIAYTFPKGAINHIHNIVQDPYRDCIWIFTGDFENSAGIWRATNNFKTVEYFAGSSQKFRGCVAYATKEGILYASDAPFADNFIYLLNPSNRNVNPLFPIDGSCIYGCKWRDKYVFSSTVEGDGRDTSRIEFYFGHKKGAGIKNNYIHMYIGNVSEGFSELYKLKKDIMPFYTFQFGAFKFPYGDNSSNHLYFQPIATSKYDLKLLKTDYVNF